MFYLKELPTEEIMSRYSERYPEMDIDKTRTALKLMRDASLLIRDLEAHFRKFDISMTRFLILIVLDREFDYAALTISDLVKKLDISKPVISNTLKKLFDGDLVIITSESPDGRVKTVTITEQGKKLVEQIMPGYYATINRHIC